MSQSDVLKQGGGNSSEVWKGLKASPPKFKKSPPRTSTQLILHPGRIKCSFITGKGNPIKAGEETVSPQLICRQTHKLRSGSRIRQENCGYQRCARVWPRERLACSQFTHYERADPGWTSAFWQESADQPGNCHFCGMLNTPPRPLGAQDGSPGWGGWAGWSRKSPEGKEQGPLNHWNDSLKNGRGKGRTTGESSLNRGFT